MTRAYIALALVTALAGLLAWAYMAGGKIERQRIEAATNASRIDTIQQTKGARDAAETLDDDSLINSLGRWLLPSQP